MATEVDDYIRQAVDIAEVLTQLVPPPTVRRVVRTYGGSRPRRRDHGGPGAALRRRPREEDGHRLEAKEEEVVHRPMERARGEGGRPPRRRRRIGSEEDVGVPVDLTGDTTEEEDDSDGDGDEALARRLQLQEDAELAAAFTTRNRGGGGLGAVFGVIDAHMREGARAIARDDLNATRDDDGEGEFTVNDAEAGRIEGGLHEFLDGIGRMMANRTAVVIRPGGAGAGAGAEFGNIALERMRNVFVRIGTPVTPPFKLRGGAPSEEAKKAVIDAEDACPICLTAFTADDDTSLWDTGCGVSGGKPHVFHEGCIKGWHNTVQGSPDDNGERKVTKCPSCMADITVPR